MGLLRVKGTIDIQQFWPTGKAGGVLSDADTVHVQVDPKTSFKFDGKPTRAFDYAWVKTRKLKGGGRAPIYVIVGQDRKDAHVKIRLQGVDAPELHYRVDPKAAEVRQHWGKRAALELRKHLEQSAQGGLVSCFVETKVKTPNDAFDKYGRLVGDIIVGGKNVNHWLARNGWAFPTLYNSMELGEIDAINQLWAQANGGIVKSVTDRTSDDMYGLAAGKAGESAAVAAKDKGKVSLPKMFRRLVAYQEHPKGATSLAAFLAMPANPAKPSERRDPVIELKQFRKLTAAQRLEPLKKAKSSVIELSTLVKDENRLTKKAEALVFVEGFAVLKNSNGTVKSWKQQGKPVKVVPT